MAIPKPEYLVSACLAGVNCTFKGKNKLKKPVRSLVEKHMAVAVCPEVIGGLGIPRDNSEIVGGDGHAVLKGSAKVIAITGKDVTKYYIAGARKILKLAKKYNIKRAILKSNSPACGCGSIYDGTFNRILVKGDGVLAALLIESGLRVYTEKDNLLDKVPRQVLKYSRHG